MNISARTKMTAVQAPLATGSASTGLLSTVIDMSGFNGCQFVGHVGTVGGTTTTVTLAVFDSSSTGGTFAAIGGATISSTGGDSDKAMVLDVYKPERRFLKAKLTRAGANAEYGGTVAQQYEPGNMPTTHDTATLYEPPVLSVSITT